MFRVTETKQVQPFPPRPGGIPPRTETVSEADDLEDAIVHACSHPTLANSVALGRLCDRLEDLFLAAVTLETKTRTALANAQPDLIARGVSALNAVCVEMADPPATDGTDDDADDSDPDSTPIVAPNDADDPIEVFWESK